MKKKITIIGLILLFIFSPIAIGDWPMYQHDVLNTGNSNTSFSNNFTQIWSKSYSSLNIDMVSMFASPISDNGKLFIMGDTYDTEFGVICALNQYNGSLIWKKEIPINENARMGYQSFHSPAVYEDKIITALGCLPTIRSKSKIVALNKNTGDIIWEKSFFGVSYYSSVTVDNDKVFVSGHFTFCPISFLYVFDVNNGDLLWRKILFGYIETTPVVYDNKVIVAPGRVSGMLLFMKYPLFSGNSRVCAFDVDSGEKIWMTKVRGHLVQCSPTASDGKLFVPSNTMTLTNLRGWICRITALDLDNGEEIWHHELNQEFLTSMWPTSISTPSVGYGKVFVMDSTGWLRVWQQDNGDLIWEKELYPENLNAGSIGFASPVVVDEKVIVVGNNDCGVEYNELFMFNESSGELLCNFKFSGGSGSPFIVSNEMLYVIDGLNGIIHAFG